MIDSQEAIENIFKQLVIPHGKRLDSVSVAEGKFIHNWVKNHHLSATLEIGLAFGASAASMLAAHQGIHVCMDPYQEKNYLNVGLENLDRLGYSERVRFHQDLSCNVLPRLYYEKAQFDFIFIDGDHRFDSIFVDFYYSDLLLANNGYILFHDSWMRGTQLVASFIRHNRNNYKQIPRAGLNLILFQKSGENKSSWDSFQEFYTLRGILTHVLLRPIVRLFNR
jgi:predicted O-methyltransferase YrrM